MVCIFGRTTKEIKIHVQLRNFSVGIFIQIKKYYYGDPNRCVEIEIVVVYFKCLLQRSKKKSPGTNDHIFYMGKTNSPCKFSNLGREHISKEVFQNFLNNIFT